MRAVPVLENRLVHRELGYHSRFSSVKGLYGDRQWVEDLDIVNELGGHTGCVNALRSVICHAEMCL
jgi:nuclear receptor interaction protein